MKPTTGNQEVIIATAQGWALKFNEKDVRSMGRNTRGVIGIRLAKGDTVIGMDVVKEDRDFLVVTENGFGKRTPLDPVSYTHLLQEPHRLLANTLFLYL